MADSIGRQFNSLLSGIPLNNLIASPLNACVHAQAEAAHTTMNFINSFGLADVNGENKEAVYVTFTYEREGQKVLLKVPILTIVPIPYIAIDTLDINFTCTLNAFENEEYDVQSLSQDYQSKNAQEKSWYFWRPRTSTMYASVSNKRSSRSTQTSEFSVESQLWMLRFMPNRNRCPPAWLRFLRFCHHRFQLKTYRKNDTVCLASVSADSGADVRRI